eukprot:1355695-Prymnesium_polylepis.1
MPNGEGHAHTHATKREKGAHTRAAPWLPLPRPRRATPPTYTHSHTPPRAAYASPTHRRPLSARTTLPCRGPHMYPPAHAHAHVQHVHPNASTRTRTHAAQLTPANMFAILSILGFIAITPVSLLIEPPKAAA